MDLASLESMTGLSVELLSLIGASGLVVITGAAWFWRRGKKPSLSTKGAAPALKSNEEVFRSGLARTRTGFLSRLNALLGGGGLDEAVLEELETLLITSDLGVKTTQRLISAVESSLSGDERKDPDVIKARLKSQMRALLGDKIAPWSWKSPTVVMVVGVNGVGKTTTIGKIAARYASEGKKVLLAAGDTFRAAAVEQLEVWGTRSNVDVVKGEDGSDPASVIFSAIEKAQNEGYDLVLCDTAGRLQTKVNLMNELTKVHRVARKAMEGCPHEVLLVLDSTTGQNAISQARKFSEAVPINALALTKLDGTAKGGIVVAISDELSLPVRFVGLGEGINDLRDFSPTDFIDSLFDERSQIVDGPVS